MSSGIGRAWFTLPGSPRSYTGRQMTISADVLRTHLDYTRWASARLLEAASALSDAELRRDFATADKSVLGTLTHIYGGDLIWLARVRCDGPPPFPREAFQDLSLLAATWTRVMEDWLDWARPLTDDDVLRDISYRDLKGNLWTTPLWQIVLHVVNHGTHHRGQAAGFLRSMGYVPPPLDLIAYYRQRTTPAAG